MLQQILKTKRVQINQTLTVNVYFSGMALLRFERRSSVVSMSKRNDIQPGHADV